MHTATRLAVALLPRVRELNPLAHICFYGLYAPVNAEYLRELGAQTILGGEFEEGLVHLVERMTGPAKPLAGEQQISLNKQKFRVPQRGGLPALAKYAHLIMPDGGYRVVGYTEASRGCKHLCRHCPIVPVYDGTFRIVQREIVLEDIRRQVAVGAQHISFGDPDFFNGPSHAMAIVQEMHREFPKLSYDATIKIEHLLNHAEHLPTLHDTGCLFVTSAVESVDDLVLERLAKGHTREGFVRVVEIFRNVGLTLQPTFVPFSPWTTPRSYLDLLQVLAEQDLVENVAPIQLAIRLLIPAGSRLLDLTEIRDNVEPFDAAALVYPWKHSDPRVDALAAEVSRIVEREEKLRRTRAEIFTQICNAAARFCEDAPKSPESLFVSRGPRVAIPQMNEPWYCCAEPSSDQLVSIGQVKPIVAMTEKALPQPDAFV
jgi:Radical SAM superfamily